MARERGITTSEQSQRFILVGSPGTSKGKISRALSRSNGLTVVTGLSLPHYDPEPAVGMLADYRVEIALASQRAFEQPKGSTIYEHTLVDSLAYSSLRYVTMRDQQNVDDYTQSKWGLVATLSGAMLRDTFKYDHIFFLESDQNVEIQESLLAVLEAFGLPYSHLDGKYKENLSNIKTTIEAYGSRSNLPKSR